MYSLKKIWKTGKNKEANQITQNSVLDVTNTN